MELKSVAGLLLKSTSLYFATIVKYVLYAIVIAIIGTIIIWPCFKNMPFYVSLLTCVGLYIGFPVLFFIMGQKAAISNSLYKLYDSNQKLIQGFVVDKFFNFVESKNPDLIEKMSSGNFDVSSVIPGFLSNIKGVPFLLKKIIAFKFSSDTLKQAFDINIEPNTPKDDIKSKVTEQLNSNLSKVANDNIKPQPYAIYFIIAIEVVLLVCIKYFYS